MKRKLLKSAVINNEFEKVKVKKNKVKVEEKFDLKMSKFLLFLFNG